MPNVTITRTREDVNAYYREYRSKNRAKIRKYNKKYNKQWRKENGVEESIKSYKHRKPEIAKVHKKLQNAVYTGKIIKSPCVVCKSKKSQGHHPDYSKPLEVIWLCALHHKHVHLGIIKVELSTVTL